MVSLSVCGLLDLKEITRQVACERRKDLVCDSVRGKTCTMIQFKHIYGCSNRPGG